MLKQLLRHSVSLVPWRVREVIKHVPLLASLQRWLLAKFLTGEEFLHTVDAGPARGLNYPIVLPVDKGIWTGAYESEFCRALSKAVRPGDVCLDIGGWRGFYGGVLALAGAKLVYVFEPLPANASQIRKLIALNPELPMIMFEAAIGERGGTSDFYVMPDTSMGKLTTSSFQTEVRGTNCIEVQVISLDELVTDGKVEWPAVAKIDVEGAEAQVLRGAKELLSRHKTKLFMEIHSRTLARECHELLNQYGYDVQVVQTGRKPDFASEPEVCHFVAVPGNGKLIGKRRKQPEVLSKIDVPILLYHHLAAQDRIEPSEYQISIRQFEQHLELLQRWGFTSISLERLFRIIKGDEPASPRMVVITFDDAFRSFIELGLPALRAHKMTASVFVPAGEIGSTNGWDARLGFPQRDLMNEDELRGIMDAGIEVGAHGWLHRNLTRCSDGELREEIFRPREEMERRFGAAPQFFAYPYGEHSPRIYPLLAEAGYQGAVGIFSNEPTVTANRFCMRRIYIHSGDTPLRFRLKLTDAYLRYKAWRGTPREPRHGD